MYFTNAIHSKNCENNKYFLLGFLKRWKIAGHVVMN